ncbi:MAG: hypothetical protein ACTSXL_02555 [Alphaproteobacteria bacterium]
MENPDRINRKMKIGKPTKKEMEELHEKYVAGDQTFSQFIDNLQDPLWYWKSIIAFYTSRNAPKKVEHMLDGIPLWKYWYSSTKEFRKEFEKCKKYDWYYPKEMEKDLLKQEENDKKGIRTFPIQP